MPIKTLDPILDVLAATARPVRGLDLRRVHQAATDGPADLLQFLAVLQNRVTP